MSNTRTLANTVSQGGLLADGTIGILDVSGLDTALDAKLPLAGGTLTGAVTFAAGQVFPGTGDVTQAGAQTLVNKTLETAVLTKGYTEEVFAVTGTTPALSPTNGSIQTWMLSANSTPTAGTWAEGQSITLMIDDGTTFTVTWTALAVTWKTNGGAAPQLLASGLTPIQLWKVGTVIYGARVGDA